MGKLYLAYGSNLNRVQMAMRCKDARIKGKVSIDGYELEFCRIGRGAAFATIIPSKGGRVPALLWEISDSDEAALDEYEGYPIHYVKENITVNYNGEPVSAMVYIMNGGYLGDTTPYYYNIIREGYLDLGFPLEYLRWASSKSAYWDFGADQHKTRGYVNPNPHITKAMQKQLDEVEAESDGWVYGQESDRLE